MGKWLCFPVQRMDTVLEKVLCTYSPRCDWWMWSRPMFAYGIFRFLHWSLEELEADFFVFKVSITRFYYFLFDCSRSSERSQKNPQWKHHQIIVAPEYLTNTISMLHSSFFLPLLLVLLSLIKPLSKRQGEVFKITLCSGTNSKKVAWLLALGHTVPWK